MIQFIGCTTDITKCKRPDNYSCLGCPFQIWGLEDCEGWMT